MASKSRGKDKKAKKEKVAEEPPASEDQEEDISSILENVQAEEHHAKIEEPTEESTPLPEPDEPSLAHLIVEHYEGDTVRGLYGGNGEAHFHGGHIYKGEFYKGMMHGRGTYTWSDGVVYQGDFNYNEITGKGVYHWPGDSTYEGEVFKGKRHGEGSFCCMGSPASYTGQWNMGQRHGTGVIHYDTDGLSFYEGDWINNKRHGYGVRRYRSGNVYEGEWANNNRHGQGTMRWIDLHQTYSGQWENGVQNGHGEHTWYIRRLPGSQYSMRNQYIGDFSYGKRHGYGVMLYASGAKYEGDWLEDKKSGRGIFTFKNGRIFEGIFVEDKMAEYPNFAMDGSCTPDISGIRTRTPDPAGPTAGNLTSHKDDSSGTQGLSLTLDIDHLLKQVTESERGAERQQVMFVVLRHITVLKKAYNYYSSLGHDASPDNTYVMTRLQFWRMLKDCRFHHLDVTIAEIDRIIAINNASKDIHSPLDKLLEREYLNHLITISYNLYREECPEKETSVIAWCFDHAIQENIIPYSCDIQGNFFYEPARAISALGYMDQCWMVYKSVCRPNKFPPHDLTLKMREFLFMLKDYGLVSERLTSKHILEILSADDPAAYNSDGCNLELEMTFLDFFEALIGCAMVSVTEEVIKYPNTPNPSTAVSPQTSHSTTPHCTTPRESCTNVEGDDSGNKAPPSSHHSLANGPSPRGGEGSPTAITRNDSLLDPQTGKQEGQETSILNSVDEGGSDIPDDVKEGKSEPTVASPAKSIPGDTEAEEPHGLLKSVLSIGGDIHQGEDDVMDNATREFNAWAHQINIFFLKKLFPAYEHMKEVLSVRNKLRAADQIN